MNLTWFGFPLLASLVLRPNNGRDDRRSLRVDNSAHLDRHLGEGGGGGGGGGKAGDLHLLLHLHTNLHRHFHTFLLRLKVGNL